MCNDLTAVRNVLAVELAKSFYTFAAFRNISIKIFVKFLARTVKATVSVIWQLTFILIGFKCYSIKEFLEHSHIVTTLNSYQAIGAFKRVSVKTLLTTVNL